jgi:hypothetical protein
MDGLYLGIGIKVLESNKGIDSFYIQRKNIFLLALAPFASLLNSPFRQEEL